jgi:hypothetical protein
MLTAGHLACGAVTAMRWLSSASSYRYHQKDATCRHPVGGGRRDGHAWRHSGGPGHGHAARDQASRRRRDAPGARCGRGGHRVRPYRAADFRVHPRRLSWTDRGAGSSRHSSWRPRPGHGNAFGQTACPEADERVFAGRPARHAQGGSRVREPTAGKFRQLGKLRHLGRPRHLGKPGNPGKRASRRPGSHQDAGSAHCSACP